FLRLRLPDRCFLLNKSLYCTLLARWCYFIFYYKFCQLNFAQRRKEDIISRITHEVTARQRTTGDSNQPSPTRSENSDMSAEGIKEEVLSSLRGEISKIIRDELKSALADDFNALKSEFQGLKSEVANNTKAMRAEVDHLKADIQDVKDGLSTWSDEVTSLQATVSSLKNQMTALKDRCEDMEGRMRRNNIRIAGIEEHPNSSSPKAVAKCIREILQLDRDVKVERSHRVLTTRNLGDREKPRVIIAKLHHDEDAVEILWKARDRAPLSYNGHRIAIFPDYTASVAKARAAFMDVRRALRGRKGICYGLLYPARLRITHQDEDKEFVDPQKAMDYVKNILPATEMEESKHK
uniref:L1 transposable element RRM domain-containing protein n=1 Tax=Myripristis murdjan TaxID=586833 RepID=A0A667Z7E4_9TELE